MLHAIVACVERVLHDAATGAVQQLRGFAGDSHDDFKPQFKDVSSSSSAIDTIEHDLKSHKVFVYMKVVCLMRKSSTYICTQHRVCQTRLSVAFPTQHAASSTPMVPHSANLPAMPSTLLLSAGVKYGSRNVLADPEIRDAIKKYSSWPTIPQVFVEGELLGGSDILMDMHKSGELVSVVERVQGGTS